MISVSSPLFLGNEKKYLQECIDSGWISDGYFVQKFEEDGKRFAFVTEDDILCVVMKRKESLKNEPDYAGIVKGGKRAVIGGNHE